MLYIFFQKTSPLVWKTGCSNGKLYSADGFPFAEFKSDVHYTQNNAIRGLDSNGQQDCDEWHLITFRRPTICLDYFLGINIENQEECKQVWFFIPSLCQV